MTILYRSLLAFAILQCLLLATPSLLSAPTTGVTAEGCMACAGTCDLKACHLMAVELATARDFGRAIAIEEAVLARDPANPEVAAALARMYDTGRKDVVNAIKLYHEALYMAPGYPPALLGLGTLMRERGEMLIAERYFERGARENPEQPLFKVRLAEVLIETGRPEKAQPILEQVVAGWPDSGEAESARRMMNRTSLASP